MYLYLANKFVAQWLMVHTSMPTDWILKYHGKFWILTHVCCAQKIIIIFGIMNRNGVHQKWKLYLMAIEMLKVERNTIIIKYMKVSSCKQYKHCWIAVVAEWRGKRRYNAIDKVCMRT